MDKEKRLIRFLLASSLVMLAFMQIQAIRNPPKPEDDQVADVEGDDNDDANDAIADDANDADDADDGDNPDANAEAAPDVEPSGDVPNEHLILGSLDPTSPYQMAVYFNNQGATIERIELNNPRYQDLDDRSGYLGFLGLKDDPKGGCRVSYVVPGSPAAAAGISAGDRIVQLDEIEIADSESLKLELTKTNPGQNVNVTVVRGNGNRAKLAATLVKRPLSLISPERSEMDEDDPLHQLSFLWTLGKVGDAKVGVGQHEIPGLPSLRDANWEMNPLAAVNGTGEGVEFSRRLTAAELSQIGGKVPLELVKRYRLTPVSRSPEAAEADKHGTMGYKIDLEMEIRNLGKAPQKIAHQLDGPTGLPLEGWWYSYKVHPRKWAGAGARDIVWKNPESGDHEMKTGSQVAEPYGKKGDKADREEALFEEKTARLNYLGVDSQYFTVALVPPTNAEGEPLSAKGNQLSKAIAFPVGPIDEKKHKRTDVTFRATSRDYTIAGGETLKEQYTIFAGPKEPDVLKKFNLDQCIVYGWFGAVARPMIKVLHFFHDWIGLSWGLSIVALTVCVRLLMFPIGRKMAMNAKKMQELGPEMKKIADKYKDNLEKRSAAQQELFKKHNYNPAAGCLMMPLQMPIFVGLYRGLSVDIGLRQAPFFEGMNWCSNLAGPDKFWYWENIIPTALGSPEGWLGPFLNLLPFVTVLLFLGQQILFTPPPQDENQEMQQKVMKFMMLFMGIMFHKVAAGLCIYMITSSLWGICERLLLPKGNTPGTALAGAGDSADPPSKPSPAALEAANKAAKRKKKRKRKK